jgi:hypothetical protein
MIKLVFKGFLTLLLITGFCIFNAHAQDSLKKAEPEKSEVKQPAVKPTAIKSAPAKPVRHYVRKAVVIPAPTVAVPADTAKTNAQAAQMDPNQLNDKSLNGQYQYLLTKVYHYQQPLIAALWKNINDSLAQARTQVKMAQAKLALQTKEMDSLKTSATTDSQTLAASNAKADAISVFGANMSKSTYNLVMFSLVGVLALALAIVIGTTAKNKHEAKYRTELYEEIEEDYKNFKAKAHEKELKLARDLQTERNKIDELLGRG